MKKIALLGLLLGATVLAVGCGGSSGSGTDCTPGETAAEAAFDDFGTIMANNDMLPCLNLTATTCDCPNGGIVNVDQTALTVTFIDCTSATDQVYNGTLTLAQDGNSFSGTMTEFDGCTNVSATNVSVEGACSGTITGTCGGQTLTCTMSDSSGECVPGNCSC